MKVSKKKESVSKERQKKPLAEPKGCPLRSNTFNKRQRFAQNKLYQRRSVTTTRGVDISPQVKTSIKSDIQRPTSSSGVENYKRNTGLKDYNKNDNMLLRSNPLDLYEFKEKTAMGTSLKTNKKAFSFVANTKKPKKPNTSHAQGKRSSSRKSNGYSKKSHSFSMTKKFKGLQKIFIKDPGSKARQHNQTPNNQVNAMMSVPPTNSMKNTAGTSMGTHKNILHHASCRRKPSNGFSGMLGAQKGKSLQEIEIRKQSAHLV
jgi:hypothetical protein